MSAHIVEKLAMRILLIEDNPDDALLLHRHLTDAGLHPDGLVVVDSMSVAQPLLSDERFDVILLDLGLPDSHGFDTLRQVLALAPATAVVIITGSDDEAMALEAVKAGAQDYLYKNDLTSRSIMRATRYAIERHRLLDELQEARRRECLERERREEAMLRHVEMMIAAENLGIDDTPPEIVASPGTDDIAIEYQKAAEKYTQSVREGLSRPDTDIRALVGRLVAMGIAAGDVARLHMNAVNAVADLAEESQKIETANSARLMLVEILCRVLDAYQRTSSPAQEQVTRQAS